ncbi:MAG: DUF1552 domain-containing protein, partial [Lentisphaeraceae bacterium]|nr:DUF1552 domain-containing protein [Lentisphaeraceae bacterium]
MGNTNLLNSNVRLAYLFMPNGIEPTSWNVSGQGKSMKLSRTLESLEPVKTEINFHDGLTHVMAGGDAHVSKTANFLSGSPVKRSKANLECGKSCDQVAAETIGKDLYLPSVELGIDRSNLRKGVNNQGYSLAYGAHIAWSTPTTPLPKEIIPREFYKRLFKGSVKQISTPEETVSVLDRIKEDTRILMSKIGKEDRYRMNEYFYSIRSLERRLDKINRLSTAKPRGVKTPQSGIPRDFETHVNLMLDLIILAFQTNRTKVATFMFANGGSRKRFDFLDGVKGGNHHDISHYHNDKNKRESFEKIVRFHVSLYSKMLQKMSSIQEGDKTLLDNSLVLFGSGIRDGNRHDTNRLPIIVAGKGGGSVRTGQSHTYKNKPLCNLLLGTLKTAGCRISQFGDSDKAEI